MPISPWDALVHNTTSSSSLKGRIDRSGTCIYKPRAEKPENKEKILLERLRRVCNYPHVLGDEGIQTVPYYNPFSKSFVTLEFSRVSGVIDPDQWPAHRRVFMKHAISRVGAMASGKLPNPLLVMTIDQVRRLNSINGDGRLSRGEQREQILMRSRPVTIMRVIIPEPDNVRPRSFDPVR